MKTIQQLLIDLNACEDARIWAEGKTIEEIVEQCHRGDWLLWLAHKVHIGLRPLTLVKGHCANTVRHLMTYDISIKAVDVAIRFGEGKETEEELNAAAGAAWAAARSAATAADAAAAGAAWAAARSAAWAAARSAATAADAAAAGAAWAAARSAAWAAARSAATAADAAAFNENLHQTADICREYIGDMIIQKCNELIKD